MNVAGTQNHPVSLKEETVRAVKAMLGYSANDVLLAFSQAVAAKLEGNQEKAERLLYEANQLWKNWKV